MKRLAMATAASDRKRYRATHNWRWLGGWLTAETHRTTTWLLLMRCRPLLLLHTVPRTEAILLPRKGSGRRWMQCRRLLTRARWGKAVWRGYRPTGKG